MSDSDTAGWARLGDRSLFPDLEAQAYLNHAAIAPLSIDVQAEIAAGFAAGARVGVGAVHDWWEAREELRRRFAQLIGGSPAGVSVLSNTTQGVTAVAMCLPWRAGDRVVLFTGEFPANVTPWQRAAALFDLEIVFLPADAFRTQGDGMARLEEELKRGVRLVAVSAVQFQTGLRMPVGDITQLCHQHGAQIFVDAIQACGVVPMRFDDIDYLTSGAQKWLMGPVGIGLLHIQPTHLPDLEPRLAGWLSHTEPMRFLFEGAGHMGYDRALQTTSAIFEGGMWSGPLCGGASVALGHLLEIGTSAVFAHVDAYLDRLESQLVAAGWRSLRSARIDERSGILSVLPPGDTDVIALARALGTAGFSVSTPDGYLRFAPHWPNALAEVDALAAACLAECAQLTRH